jgi:hypothetical protein
VGFRGFGFFPLKYLLNISEVRGRFEEVRGRFSGVRLQSTQPPRSRVREKRTTATAKTLKNKDLIKKCDKVLSYFFLSFFFWRKGQGQPKGVFAFAFFYASASAAVVCYVLNLVDLLMGARGPKVLEVWDD